MFCLLFLVSSVFIVVGFAGEIHFPRTPISYSVPGFHFPWVAPLPPAAEDFVLLTCPPAAANSSPPASRAAAEGLRSAAFTSAARRIPRFFTGRQSRANHHKYMVGVLGFEPRTSSLSGTRSNQLSYTPILDYRSFSTAESLMVESKGLEPSTSCLQSRCSSH